LAEGWKRLASTEYAKNLRDIQKAEMERKRAEIEHMRKELERLRA
jgi:hypothetical protein